MRTAPSAFGVRTMAGLVSSATVVAMLVVSGMTASSSTLPRPKPVQPAGPAIPLINQQAASIQAASSNSNGSPPANALPIVASSIYNNIPGPLPPNVPSLGYQATQSAEFGDLIQFAGTNRLLTQVTIVMSDWALASDWPSFNTGPTWNHPITMALYNVNNSGPNPAPGTVIATRTATFPIPWRPVADPTCPGGTAWRAGDGNCYNGLAFTIAFDFTGTTVPNQIIYGVAFNTQTWGYHPIGVPGPYESLNFGLATTPPEPLPSVGSRPFPDTAYWNTQTAANYTDLGAGGVGTFRRDTNWTPFSGAASFVAVPPPPVFTTCLKDTTTGDFIQWNTSTGAYSFTHCGPNGFTLTGTGQVSLVNGIQWLKDKKADRIISVGRNAQSTGGGNVTVSFAPGISQNFRINDTNPNPTCACS